MNNVKEISTDIYILGGGSARDWLVDVNIIKKTIFTSL